MPFLTIIGLAVVLLPLVMWMTNLRAEVVLLFAVALLFAFVFRRISLVFLFNTMGWALTVLSFLPGFAPGRWLRKRPKVKV